MARRAWFRVLTLAAALGVASLALWGCTSFPWASGATPGQGSSPAPGSAAGPAGAATSTTSGATTSADALDFFDPAGDYRLEQVVVLSRHNIRAPLSTNGSALAKATPHRWIDWTAQGSELTSRGAALETMSGAYFRAWLEHEGLADHNWRPDPGAVRVYANAKERTIATARAFAAGALPAAPVEVETHVAFDTMDPTFTPQTTYLTDAYADAARTQVADRFGAGQMSAVASDLSDSFALIADVCDLADSEGYKSGEIGALDTTDTGVAYELNKEPAMTGSLKLACQLSDALVLQYYESTDERGAAFGESLSQEQWSLISRAKDRYNDVLFSAPLVAVNVAHPLLGEIGRELDADGRQFSFLCGHDSNIVSVLGAMGVRAYDLPGSVEAGTPIGSKLVFERWSSADGRQFGRVRLVYQDASQLRSGSMLSGYESPKSVTLDFDGVEKSADGLVDYAHLRERIASAYAAYDALPETYGEQGEPLAPAA
ncbi:histidine-type phosphatase [Olsenella intestinalis]|uniref:histidine-type phosphatase n=1 Tax=Olsenella intestinalis TaxID=2930083 RepID=UPI00201058FE|nr:histidine-type phosphatase [Olsenella intestinalis]